MEPSLTVAVCARDDRHRLALCLEGLALQSMPDSEVVVINDGGPPLDDVLAPFAGRLTLRSDRLEPPSDAYRLASARNLALRHARADRVLFLDQDCVAGPEVLATHASYGSLPTVVAGMRLHLPESEVWAIGPSDIPNLLSRDLRPDFRLRLSGFRALSGRSMAMIPWCVTGCHVSFPAAVLRDIGGYWDAFVGWGHEDIEVAIRLGRAGCSLTVRTDLSVVHLDHPSRRDPEVASRNYDLLGETQRDQTIIRRGPPLDPIDGPHAARPVSPPPPPGPGRPGRP